MSTVFLGVGQCGNQVIKPLFKTLSSDIPSQTSNTYMSQDGYMHSVHVDSEPKVLNQLKKSNKVRPKNLISGKRGRGSNWALGYYGLKSQNEDYLITDSKEALRKEIEKCDSFQGIVLIHSLSGGTGSGLGSRLCESIRDDYPLNFLLSCAYAPFSSGESPLQHYNSLLTLAYLHNNVDGIILSYNDELLYRQQKQTGADISLSLDELNQYSSNALSSLLLPTDSLTSKRGIGIGMEPWELIKATCPMTSTKFLHINYLMKSKLSWDALISQTLKNVIKYSKQGIPYKCISGVVVGRGDVSGTFHHSLKQHGLSKIRTAYNCVSWNPFPFDIWSAKDKQFGAKDNSSLTIAANYSNIIPYLETLLNKAKLMYNNKAYLHWYWRYGATKDIFEEAFQTVDNIIEEYNAAIK